MIRVTKERIDDMIDLHRELYEERPVEIRSGCLLAGDTLGWGVPCSEKPWWMPGSRQVKPENEERPPFRGWGKMWNRNQGFDNNHFPPNYRFAMDHGIGGIIQMCRAPIADYRDSMTETDRLAETVYVPELSEREEYRRGIAEMYEIIRDHIAKHASLARSLAEDAKAAGDAAEVRRLCDIAETCEALCEGDGGPKNFRQGVQLFWFLWRARNNMTSPVGRLDVTLRKLYDEDILAGKSSREDAFVLLCELWERFNEQNSGDTLMNLMLGGVDADGNDVSSDLSVLMMEVTMKVAKSEPHVNVRIHDGTPDFFKEKAAEMIAMGQGQGVVYGDNLIIPQLVSCFGVLASALPDAMNAAYEWLDERFEISALVNEWSLTLPQSKEEWGALIQKIAKPILAGMGGVMTAAVSMTSSVIGNIVTFFMALLFAVHLLLNKEKLQGQFKRLFEKLLGRRINGVCHVLNVANKSFRGYIVGQCIEALILGTLCALGMLILRLPYALMIGALVGVLALIPIAGAYIAAAIGAIMIFSVSPVKAVIFLIFLVILQQIEGNLIYPHTVGSTLQLPGIWVLAAVLIGGGVMGIPGMMISVPLMATAYQLLKQWVNSDRVLPCRRSMEG